MVDYHSTKLFAIGGMTDSGGLNPGTKYFGTPSNKVWVREGNGQWAHAGDLLVPRVNFETVLNKESIFVFCGFNGKAATTQIEIFHIDTGETSKCSFRLPLGVVGTSVAWHGDDILTIGGERLESKSTAVMKLDFQNKNILSLRDLIKPRDNSILIPMAHDEVLAIGGSGSTDAEIRKWCDHLQDYRWFDCTKKIKNISTALGGKPDEYSSVLTTFCVSASDEDNFPSLNPDSNFIFGNELSPFLLEITKDLGVNFYPAPMRLQQKTGQVAFRADSDTIFFIAGTDSTYTLLSKKTFRFSISGRCVDQIGNLEEGRYNFAIQRLGVS